MNLNAEDSISDTLHVLPEYKDFFTQIKNQVRSSRLQAALAVNSEVIKRMKLFAQLFPSTEIGSQAVIQLPCGHIIIIIHKVIE